MQYRPMGKTGEQVSALSFGCMRLPIVDGDNTKIDEKTANMLIDYAIDNGVNYFDTAYPYHGKSLHAAGQSEPLLGRALKGKRQDVLIATKLPTWMVATRQDMDTFLDEQLNALQSDYIDFYLLHTLSDHNYDRIKSLGVFEFLQKAKKAGKIKHIGFSFHDSYDVFARIVNDYDWAFAQIQYNYIDTQYQAGKKGLDLLESKNMGAIIMEPLRGKILAEIDGELKQLLTDLDAKRPMVDWAISWLLNQSGVTSVLSGMNRLDHLKQNIAIAAANGVGCLTDEQVDAVAKVRTAVLQAIKVPCTACGYCCPCPHGVDIRNCFSQYNNFHLLNSNSTAQKFALYQYPFRIPEKARASVCVACHACEAHCPQHIKIADEMQNVARVLENK